jgi:hypothetical protein
VLVAARQRATRAVTLNYGVPIPRTISSMSASAPSRSWSLSQAARNAPSAAAPSPAAVGPVPSGVGDGQPGAVAVLDEVEPVAADLVGRQQAAGQLAAGDADDPRREEVLLDSAAGVIGLRRRAAVSASV